MGGAVGDVEYLILSFCIMQWEWIECPAWNSHINKLDTVLSIYLIVTSYICYQDRQEENKEESAF